jgi:hypothetical protein
MVVGSLIVPFPVFRVRAPAPLIYYSYSSVSLSVDRCRGSAFQIVSISY